MMEEKKKAIEKVRQDMKKLYGEGCLFYLGSDERSYVQRLSSGSISLDVILGGGYPMGRIIEIFGHESSGKTTLALTAVAQAQRKGGIAAYIDVEQALDIKYANDLGVNVKDLVIAQPDSGEDALSIAEMLLRSGAIDILVIDSVSALVTEAELEGGMGDSHVGRQARLMGQALRKLTPVVKKSNCIVIFINQLREKVGVMFGNNEVTSGGRALKFFSSVRLDVRRVNTIKQGTDFIGNRVRVKTVKNKVAPPLRQVEFDIMYGEGISKSGDLLDLGVELDIVKKTGSWYSYNDIKIGQGRDKSKLYLESNPSIMDELEQKIRIYYELDNNSSDNKEISKEEIAEKIAKRDSGYKSVKEESDNNRKLDITKDNVNKEINDKNIEVESVKIEDTVYLKDDKGQYEASIDIEDKGSIDIVKVDAMNYDEKSTADESMQEIEEDETKEGVDMEEDTVKSFIIEEDDFEDEVIEGEKKLDLSNYENTLEEISESDIIEETDLNDMIKYPVDDKVEVVSLNDTVEDNSSVERSEVSNIDEDVSDFDINKTLEEDVKEAKEDLVIDNTLTNDGEVDKEDTVLSSGKISSKKVNQVNLFDLDIFKKMN